MGFPRPQDELYNHEHTMCTEHILETLLALLITYLAYVIAVQRFSSALVPPKPAWSTHNTWLVAEVW